MKFVFSKKLVVGATGLVLLAGGGGAIAATQLSGGSGRQAYLDDVAKHLGVSPRALTAAMKAAATDRVNGALAAGRITQAQANELKQRIARGDVPPFVGHRFRGRFGGGAFRAGASAATSYLGISKQTLRDDLASGKTLAQIASSTPGKSVAGLKSAILNAEQARLDKAVSAGVISSQEAKTRLSMLAGRIDSILSHKWMHGHGDPGFGPHGPRFGPGRPGFGPPPPGFAPSGVSSAPGAPPAA